MIYQPTMNSPIIWHACFRFTFETIRGEVQRVEAVDLPSECFDSVEKLKEEIDWLCAAGVNLIRAQVTLYDVPDEYIPNWFLTSGGIIDY